MKCAVAAAITSAINAFGCAMWFGGTAWHFNPEEWESPEVFDLELQRDWWQAAECLISNLQNGSVTYVATDDNADLFAIGPGALVHTRKNSPASGAVCEGYQVVCGYSFRHAFKVDMMAFALRQQDLGGGRYRL